MARNDLNSDACFCCLIGFTCHCPLNASEPSTIKDITGYPNPSIEQVITSSGTEVLFNPAMYQQIPKSSSAHVFYAQFSALGMNVLPMCDTRPLGVFPVPYFKIQ